MNEVSQRLPLQATLAKSEPSGTRENLLDQEEEGREPEAVGSTPVSLVRLMSTQQPSTTEAPVAPSNNELPFYKFLVLDSGPMLRQATAVQSLWKRAETLYTVPAVLAEIRDSKSRQAMELHQGLLLFNDNLQTRVPSSASMQAVTEFARQTGDLYSLSHTDKQVLALLYELEAEANGGDIRHIRTKPKRTLGLGRIETLGNNDNEPDEEDEDSDVPDDCDDEGEDDDVVVQDSANSRAQTESKGDEPPCAVDNDPQSPKFAKSWSMIVNPSAAPMSVWAAQSAAQTFLPTIALPSKTPAQVAAVDSANGGQFSDAEDDPFKESNERNGVRPLLELPNDQLLDPQLVADLQTEFPSLAASMLVPYDEEDTGAQPGDLDQSKVQKVERISRNEKKPNWNDDEEEERRKQEALKPLTKSGKLYNSFKEYGDLLKPKPASWRQQQKNLMCSSNLKVPMSIVPDSTDSANVDNIQSRIMGGMTLAGQEDDVEDDGEGWITCTKDIRTLKAAGNLRPTAAPAVGPSPFNALVTGPPDASRAACCTTDFAMQNVILQMSLQLLSVDGMRIRRLKSWVTRCGACFKIYTSNECGGGSVLAHTKRLFCEHCGSDMMQRIAASVDGKTGRLKLHFSKRYKNNLRGTKFSLPKPGSGNRFQGDLLLREDQLLTGAWNQKVKIRSGGKAKSATDSIFGKDIATHVGCHTQSLTLDDIQVGFGRRNPNAVKGRERRGKKKKSVDKACGLRRY